MEEATIEGYIGHVECAISKGPVRVVINIKSSDTFMKSLDTFTKFTVTACDLIENGKGYLCAFLHIHLIT